VHGEPSLAEPEVVGLDLLDEIAVIVLIQLGRDRVFQIEAPPKQERRGRQGLSGGGGGRPVILGRS
jgi:hypothetical protein